MADRDVLFTVRNNFFLGAYQAVINEASDMEDLSDSDQTEKDCFLYRSYIALGSYDLVIKEISDSSPMALQAVKLLAQYLSSRLSKEDVLSVLSDWLNDPACNRNATVLLIAGMIYSQEGNYVEALKACHTGLSLEMMALCVQIYLKMDRIDKAELQLKSMVSLDDDATLTQLASAWVNSCLGGAKVQEASYIYQELGEKYNWTASLYNGRATCAMKMGKYEDAEHDLQDAFNKDAKDPDTLANLITCGLHLNKNVARYLTQLKLVAANHPLVKKLDAAEDLFNRAAASLA